MSEIKNARIESTMLGYEDHGILTCYLTLNYGGAGQAFGGYSFDGPPPPGGKGRVAGAFGMQFIAEVLRVAGVERWERLPGTLIRVEASHDCVHRIGNALRDDWFDPKALAKEKP